MTEVLSVRQSAFGTAATVLLDDADLLGPAAEILRVEIDAVDRACSRFRPDSEISAVNDAGGSRMEVSSVFAEALAAALRAARLTDGIVTPAVGSAMRRIGYDRDFGEVAPDGPALVVSFEAVPAWQLIDLDPVAGTVRVPAGVELDLGATAKAWCADRIAARIHSDTGHAVLVSLGGDISVAGAAPGGEWVVQMADRHDAPLDEGGPCVSIVSGGLATSSSALRRWARGGRALHHLVDPGTGAPAETVWRTASVAAASCLDANVASCAAMILGPRGPAWLRERALPGRLVSFSGEVVTVGGWPADGQVRPG